MLKLFSCSEESGVEGLEEEADDIVMDAPAQDQLIQDTKEQTLSRGYLHTEQSRKEYYVRGN